MKTLLIAGLAGVLTVAPGTAIAAVESTPTNSTLVDLSFASPTAIAASSEGMKAPRAKMGGHKMSGHRMKGMNRQHSSKMRNRGGGKNYDNNRGHRKGNNGRRGVRNSNFGFFYGGGFPTLGYSQPAYYVQQPTYNYAQPQPSYYPVPYPVPTPVAYPAPAPTTVIIETVAPKGKGLTKPVARIAAQGHQSIPYDHRVAQTQSYPSGPVTQGGTTYRGDWDGTYREDGSYQGNWQGTYQDAEGRVYDGEYAGTFIGEGGAAPAGANYARGGPVAPQYDDRDYDDRDYDRRYSREQEEIAYMQQCRKSSGIGGAVVGGALGALAGNRIAGRGNRLGGSLIGGGLGAIAGAAIEQGSDRCRKLMKKYGYDRNYAQQRVPVQRAPQRAPVQAHHGYGYGYGWQGHYQQPAYYQAQPQVTTVVIQSQPVTTTTTTTTIEEEYVYEKPQYVAKKRYKPAKRVWKPRAKPAPVLKGCQQSNCYYDQ